MSAVKISAVICTYNRAGLLPGILNGVCSQQVDPQKVEVIVVDNNSVDATRSVVETYTGRSISVRYCWEPRQGLSNARNRGWQEARGAYIAYVDDDCHVPPDWLNTAIEIIDRQAPQIFGGPYFPFYNSPKPGWFKDEYGTNFMGDTARSLRVDEYLSGGNLFIQRSLLKALGGFNPELGMSGKKVAYGEETILIRQARKMIPGINVYYDPRLYVYHLVQPDKMRLSKVFLRSFAEGRYIFLTFSAGERRFTIRHALGLIGMPFLILYEAILGVIFRNRKTYPYYQNYYYEHLFHRMIVFGRLYERLRQSTSSGNVGEMPV